MKRSSRFLNGFIIAAMLIGLSPLSAPAQVHAAASDGGTNLTVTTALADVKVNSFQHNQGYATAVTGVPVDLASVSFKANFNDSTSGTINGDQLQWSSASSNISFADGKMTVLSKGVYPVTVQKDGASITMQVVAKDPADSEYVLYEENFDALANGSMPQGWTRKEGSTASKAAVKDGAFEIDALAAPDNPSRVLLPDYLGLFGDYQIEADVTIVAANDNARWDSIMFRIQNNDYPYYHMNVRKGATAANGIEFAQMRSDKTWEVFKTASFSEAIDSSKMYHYMVKAYGNRVQLSINDKLLIDNDGASAYTKGGIGLQANGNKMRVDNIRITVQKDALTGDKVNSLQHDQRYVTAVAGVPVDLASVSFKANFNDSTSGTIKGDQLQWSSVSSNISFADGKMTVLSKGVYLVTVQKDGVSITMQVVAKNSADSEYVLYEENFNSLANGSMPQGWTRKQGSTASKAVVKDGAFEIDALAAPDNPTRVLLPDYLGFFGDYKIEADVTIVTANNNLRWDSIMFRIQNNDYPYYQMAVRQNATAANGIEFAQRKPDNTWEVFETASFSEAINSSKMYRYTVKAHSNRVQLSINNKVLIDSDGASAYTKGQIGLQADGNKMRVDNIRITLQQDALPPMPADRFVQVKEPETKIALAPTVVTELKSAGQLDSLSGPQLPATVFLYVNSQLTVTDPSGQTEIGSLDSVLTAIDTRMIPAFYVKDEQTVDSLVEYLQNVGLEDADIISDNGALVKRAREAYPIIRGIVDFTANIDWSVEKLLEIRGHTNVSQAKIILLPQNAASKDNVAYLQKLGMTVWTKEQAVPAEKNLAIHTLITAGTNGIVTDSPLQAIDAMKLYSNQTTLVRKPYIVGHRGMPSTSPENTIVGNVLAIEAGAELIETDVYLSKDGHPVILHDGSLERTTNGTGFIENYTLEQIKQLNANKQFPLEFHNVQIPTLEEQIDLARQSGLVIQVEVKTSNPAVIEAIVKLIKEKHAEDLITVISFDSNQIKRMNEQMPELTTELIVGSGISRTWDVNRAVRQTLLTVQNLNAVYNANFTLLTQDYMEAAKHRGLTIAPWTFNNRNDLIQFFMYGTWGLTTDYAYWASDWTASIKPGQEKYTLSENQSVDVSAEIQTYKGALTTISPEIVLLDGQDIVEVNGSTITAKQSGTAHALLRYTTTIDAGNQYDLYTQPVSFTVEAAVINVPVAGVILDKTEVTLTEGEQASLIATAAPEDATNKAVTWSSDNENVATVDANGLLTAVKAGTANITVTTVDGGLTATAAVTVEAAVSKPGDVTNVKVVPGDQQLAFTWEDPADITQVKFVVSGGTDTVVYTVDQGVESSVVTDLANGTEYNIHLSTIDADGNESDGFSVKGTPKAASQVDTTSPREVTGQKVIVSDQKLILSWTDPTDSDLDSIKISGHGDTETADVFVDKGVETYTFEGLRNRTQYEFLITTLDTHGNESSGIVVVGTPRANDDGNTSSGGSGSTGNTSDGAEVNDNGQVSVKPTLNANGKAAAKLGAGTMKSALEKATGDTLQIKVEAAANRNELEIELPVDELLSNGSASINTIEVDTGFATVTVSTKLISRSSEAAKNVTISVAKADVSRLPAETQDQLKDAVVYDFNLAVDGKKVSEFDGRSDVQVAVPYELQPGEHPNKVVIYYISDNGELKVVTNGKYNAETGNVEFKPKHSGKYAAAYVEASFKDVTKAWAKDSIEALAARGIVSGMGEGQFKPDGKVTRAEFITMLMNVFGLTDANATTTLSDVKAGAWYYDQVATAYQLGIVSGRPNGSFGVHEEITRQDMAVMAYQAANHVQLQLSGSASEAFTDRLAISDYAQKAVAAMQAEGIINGMGNGEFAPKQQATRAQAAVIIHAILDRM